jgi:hypothetical protein
MSSGVYHGTLRCLFVRLPGLKTRNVASQAVVMASVNFCMAVPMSSHCLTLWLIALSVIVKSFPWTWQ